MILNQNCGIVSLLTESCPTVVQALYVLSLKLTLTARQTEMSCVRRLDMFHCRKMFFIYVSASKQIKPR
jgi:hypothetical protein